VFYPRHVRGLFLESLQDSPAVVIPGPRQCGKTTLAQAVCAPEHLDGNWRPATGAVTVPTYDYITFDDAARNASRADPAGFVADLPDRVVLDEVQRVHPLLIEPMNHLARTIRRSHRQPSDHRHRVATWVGPRPGIVAVNAPKPRRWDAAAAIATRSMGSLNCS